MIEVEGPDGVVIEFPAGTPQDVMQRVMRERYGAPEQPQAAGPMQDPDIPLPGSEPEPAPAPEERGFWENRGRALRVGAQGLARTPANLLGLPGDLLQLAGNALQYGTALGADVLGFPETAESVRGMTGANLLPTSDELKTAAGNDIRHFFGDGIIMPDSEMTPWERVSQSANEFAGESLLGTTALARGAGTRAADMLTSQPAREAIASGNAGKMVRGDVAAGVGAGAGLQAMQENQYTQSIRELSPVAAVIMDTLGTLAGGVSGTTAVHSVPPAVRQLPTALSAPKPPEFTDPQTSAPFRPQIMDLGAKFMQGDQVRAGVPTAGRIAERVQAFADDGFTKSEAPTVGMMAGADNLGLAMLERTMRGKNELPFVQRDQARGEAARGIVDNIATPGDGRAFTDTATGIVNERRSAAADRALREASEAEARRNENIGAIDAETERRRLLAQQQRDSAVSPLEAEAERAATEAAQAGQRVDEFGRQLPSREDAGVMRENANQRIDELAVGEMTAAQQRRGQMYDRLSTEFGTERVPLAEVQATIDGMARDGLIEIGDVFPERLAQRLTGVEDATIRDLNDMRRFLASQAEVARRAGDFTRADNIRDVSRTITASIVAHGQASANPELSRLSREIQAFENSEFGPRFRTGEANQFRRDFNVDPANRSKTPPSQTADRFVKPNRPENIATLRRMFPQIDSAGGGNEALRDKLIADLVLSGAVDQKTGRLRGTAVGNWIDKRWGERTLEEASPGLVNELRNMVAENDTLLSAEARARSGAADATSALKTGTAAAEAQMKGETASIKAEAGAGRRAVETQFAQETRRIKDQLGITQREIDKGALHFALDAEPGEAIGSIMSSKDPARNMKAVVDEIRDNPQAMEGMRQAVREHLLDEVTNAETGVIRGKYGEAARPVSPAKISALVEKNWDTLAEVFDEKQMNDLRKVHSLLKDERVVKNIGALQGSRTQQLDQQQAALKNALEGAVKLKFGMLQGGGIMRALKQLGAAVSGDSYQNQVDRLLTQAMLDPELAQHLMLREVKDVDAPAWNRRLFYLLGVSEISEEDSP